LGSEVYASLLYFILNPTRKCLIRFQNCGTVLRVSFIRRISSYFKDANRIMKILTL
jgi:hypothetical protein